MKITNIWMDTIPHNSVATYYDFLPNIQKGVKLLINNMEYQVVDFWYDLSLDGVTGSLEIKVTLV